VVEPGWQAAMGAGGALDAERVRRAPVHAAMGTEADPVMLEVFNNLFMNIAEQMGLRLQNTATRSTSRSGWTSPARCSMPRAS
jgi:5-oxoprolinase (ATP-hydrolysing)